MAPFFKLAKAAGLVAICFLLATSAQAQPKNYLKATFKNGTKTVVVEKKYVGDIPDETQQELEQVKKAGGKLQDLDLKVVVDQDGKPNSVSFEIQKRGEKTRIFGHNLDTNEKVFDLNVNDFNDSVSLEAGNLASLIGKFIGNSSFSFSLSSDDDEKKSQQPKPTSKSGSTKTFVLEPDSNDRSAKGFTAVRGKANGNAVQELLFTPNPGNGMVAVTFTVAAQQELSLEVFDQGGKQLFMEKIPAFKGDFSRKMEFTHYAEGTYFMHIKVGESLISRKIIIGM